MARRRTLALLGVLLASAALVFALLRPRAVPVELASVSRGPLAVIVAEEGQTRIRDRHVVSSPVAGRLVPRELDEGTEVVAGTVVAQLFPTPLDPRDRQRAEAALAAALAGREAAAAQVAEAAAALRQAERTRARAESLATAGNLSREELDLARTEEATRGESLDASRHRLEAAECEVAAARATLGAGEGAHGGGEIAVCAPVEGRILRRFELSERVVPAGTPVVEVGDPGRLEVVVEVLSHDALRISPGMPMEIDPGQGPLLAGVVERIEPAAFTKVSPLGVEEQRVRLVGTLRSAEATLGDRYRVTARIVVWRDDDVLQVPSGAVFRHDDGWAVFTVRDGRARLTPIELGHRAAEAVEVRTGVSVGDPLVVYPGDEVDDGARVVPER